MANYQKLDECQRSEYKRLQDLDAREKAGWLNSLRLDQPYEGRNEFFGAHWQRLGDLFVNPYWTAETMYQNMEAFAKEGVVYLELQSPLSGYQKPDGTPVTLDEAADIFRNRLAAADARATGVTVRFQTTSCALRRTPKTSCASLSPSQTSIAISMSV